jgi:hypothetical protein
MTFVRGIATHDALRHQALLVKPQLGLFCCGSHSDFAEQCRNFKTMPMQERTLLVPMVIFLTLSLALLGAYFNYLAHAGNSFNDFFVFWSAARDLQQQPLAHLYDAAAFQDFMRSLALTPIPATPHPFLYPPPAALLFAPFGLIPFRTSLLLWNGLSLTLYLAAAWQALRPRTALALVAMLAPATMVNLLFGQTGLLTSALTLFGFSLLAERPVRSGILLGLLVIKPQLALLPLLILLILRKRRAIVAAALTVLLLVTASLLAFGVDAWQAWLSSLNEFSGQLSTSDAHQHHGATVYFGLLSIGMNAHIALAIQAFTALLVLGAIIRVIRRGAGKAEAIMAALIGPFLASPYALIYDLPMIGAVCVMLFNEGRRGGFLDGELLAITAAWVLPLLAFVPEGRVAAVVPVVLCGLLLVVLRRSAAGSAAALPEATPACRV